MPHPRIDDVIVVGDDDVVDDDVDDDDDCGCTNEDYLGAGLAAPPRGVFDRGRDILI